MNINYFIVSLAPPKFYCFLRPWQGQPSPGGIFCNIRNMSCFTVQDLGTGKSQGT